MGERTEAVVGVRAWPENVCADDTWRPKLAAPFRHEGWIYHTNGHAMVAVPDDGREAAGFPIANDGPMRECVGELTGVVVDLPLPELRAWCGPAYETCTACKGQPTRVECKKCDGEGTHFCICPACDDDHEAECPSCDGQGWNGCRECGGCGFHGHEVFDRMGTWRGKPFNRRLLASVVENAPGDSVRLAWGSRIDSCLMMAGDGWRAIIMPTRHDGSYENREVRALEDMPGFPTESITSPTDTEAHHG